MPGYTLFISDLHLDPRETKITERFLSLLKNEARNADALYMLGDIFEAWIGDDDLNEFNTRIINAIRNLADNGVPVYCMRGNRDFLLGKRFAKHTHATLLEDPSCINLYGQQVLLMHGDLLCTLDEKYQRFRRYTNNTCLQWIANHIPLSWRRKAAAHLRGKSKQHQKKIDLTIMDVTDSAVQAYMRQFNVTHLIHGHTHRPAIHRFELNGTQAERIVLGAWEYHAEMLRYNSDGRFELIKLM